jgi:hypothetical protein
MRSGIGALLLDLIPGSAKRRDYEVCRSLDVPERAIARRIGRTIAISRVYEHDGADNAEIESDVTRSEADRDRVEIGGRSEG